LQQEQKDLQMTQGYRRHGRQQPENPAYEAVELRLAADGAALWLAIEAAQYGRVLLHEEPQSEREERAMSSFAETFSRYTEEWEEAPLPTKGAFLQSLGEHVGALRDQGLYVHWGSVDRKLTDETQQHQDISLVVLSIDRRSTPTMQIMMPLDLNVSLEEPEGPD
jgi:hypothetical protein